MTVHIVTGPPASGKSTWVREHAKHGDITIDYDDLAATLTVDMPSDVVDQPPNVVAVVQAARDAAINEAAMYHADVCDVYIVHAMPDRHAMNRYRKHRYQIVTIDPGYDECMRRAQAERTPRQQALVHDWYQRRGYVA